jgi:hypothetical protein
MDGFWLYVALAVAGCAGFLLFALLHVSRESSSKPRTTANPGLLPFELEGDTVTRF